MSEKTSQNTKGTFTDPRDGKTYRTVKIGKQIWMAENLNYEAEGSRCYDNDPANGQKYGRLYNWETAMKVCPKGWHLPNKEEFQTLRDFVGGEEIAGEKLKAKSGWNKRDARALARKRIFVIDDKYPDGKRLKPKRGNNGNGTDEFEFSALPGGIGKSDGSFSSVGGSGYWWTANEAGNDWASLLIMHRNFEDASYSSYDKTALCSVRCLKD